MTRPCKKHFGSSPKIEVTKNSFATVMKKYRWGFLGLGKIAHKFASDLSLSNQAERFACGSRSASRSAAFAAVHSLKKSFDSYESLAQCPDLDIVYIGTPHSSHCELTLLCLEHGKAVLCEKPIGLNRAEALRMTEAAKHNGVFLMEALWTRFLPPTLHLLDILNQGVIGKIHALQADFGFPAVFEPQSRLFDPALGGGALLDIGIYPAFLAYLILGKPQHIAAASSYGKSGVDEDTGMIFTYANGAIAHLHANVRYFTPTEATIYGAEGQIKLANRWHHTRELILTNNKQEEKILHFDYPCTGYQFEAEEVMRCLDNGLTESPLWPLQSSLDLMEILDDVRVIMAPHYR
jgi:predicted dehydrogenase